MMNKKEIALRVFEALVTACGQSKYGNLKDDNNDWYYAAVALIPGLSDDDFNVARLSLLKSGFVSRQNVRTPKSKYSAGMFVIKPTKFGLFRWENAKSRG